MSASGDDADSERMSDNEVNTDGTEPASPNAAAAEGIARVRHYFASSDEWLDGAAGGDAVDVISNVEFEVARLLDDEAGEDGMRFKETTEYTEGMAKLAALKQQHEDAAAAAAAAAPQPPPQPAVAAAHANTPLGSYGALLSLISNGVLADERHFKVLLAGLRSQASKGEHEAEWKAAGLALYQRHQQASVGMVMATFEQAWTAAVDRRLDARVITHYARCSDEPRFLRTCQSLLFANMTERERFSEVELRDYFLLAFGDILVRIHDARGTGIWWLRKWKWDQSGRTLQNMVMSAVQKLYIDLQSGHNSARDALGDSEDDQKQKTQIDGHIKKTAKALAAYGNQQNKNVTALVESHLEAQSHEIDPFDSNRLIFAFTNKVYDFKTRSFAPHSKFDYALTNCGREWREPSAAQLAKVKAVVEEIMPDEDERKMLVSVLRNGLSGVRPERFVIFTGDGRNGKGLLTEWLLFVLGEYGHAGNLTVITEKQKSGANTELRGQHKKRAVIYSEPEDGAVETLRLSEIKRLTGNETINARGLFDARDKTEMHAIQILECNKLPAIVGDKGESARERVGVLHFPFTFTADETKLASSERGYDDALDRELDTQKYKRIDTSLKDPSFKEEHYCAFFKYLIESYPLEGDVDGVGVHVSEKAKLRAAKYLDANDALPAWMNDNYEIVEDRGIFLTVKELFAGFKKSDYFQGLTAREKRSLNESKFKGAIRKSCTFKSKYREPKSVRLSHGVYNGGAGLVDVQKKSEE